MAERTDDERLHDNAERAAAEQDPTVKRPAVHCIRTVLGWRPVLRKWQENALLRALDAVEPICDLATDITRDPADNIDAAIRDLLREYGVLPGLEPGENDEHSP